MEQQSQCSASTSHGADVPTSYKQERHHDITQSGQREDQLSDNSHNTAITSNDTCTSKEDNILLKSKTSDQCSLYEPVKCEDVLESIGFHSKYGCQLVELPGEIDCKSEISDNMSSFVILGDPHIHTIVELNDTVNQEPCISMDIDEVKVKEENTLGL